MQPSSSPISPVLQRYPVKQQLPSEAGAEGESYRRWAGPVHTFYLSSCTGITYNCVEDAQFKFQLWAYTLCYSLGCLSPRIHLSSGFRSLPEICCCCSYVKWGNFEQHLITGGILHCNSIVCYPITTQSPVLCVPKSYANVYCKHPVQRNCYFYGTITPIFRHCFM